MDTKTKSVRTSALREEIQKSEKMIEKRSTIGASVWWHYSRKASLEARIKEIQDTPVTSPYLA